MEDDFIFSSPLDGSSFLYLLENNAEAPPPTPLPDTIYELHRSILDVDDLGTMNVDVPNVPNGKVRIKKVMCKIQYKA